MRPLLLVLVLSTFTALPATADVLYVDADVAVPGDGSSWASAFDDLQDALAVAEAGDAIWVAEGIYLPTRAPESVEGFVLVDGVARARRVRRQRRRPGRARLGHESVRF